MKMNIPKFFHPILGIIVGAILFLIGMAILSVVFVGAIKAGQYAIEFIHLNFPNLKFPMMPSI